MGRGCLSLTGLPRILVNSVLIDILNFQRKIDILWLCGLEIFSAFPVHQTLA